MTESDILSLYADYRPEIGAKAANRFLAAREKSDKQLVLSHTMSEVSHRISLIAAKDAVESYKGLRDNTNISNTALAQSQIAGAVTQGNLTAAMTQLMAFETAKNAAEDYEREITRRQELAQWVQSQRTAEVDFNASQAGIAARRDSMREGLLYQIH